jgi:peptidoglycan/xylan/chitin deacetylase (PgdA/CDA1 family)
MQAIKISLFSFMSIIAVVSPAQDTSDILKPVSRVAVLTFDDSVKSHRTFVGPLLKELGFGATFFITGKWMEDTGNFMNWQDVAELHQMGFEIGNHTWTHLNLSKPEAALKLSSELAQIDAALAKVGIPKPVSFAWPGNGFGPESLEVLRKEGYRFARRGMQPEEPYGQVCLGPLYDPASHDPLLIPTSGDAYPSWNLEHFKSVVDRVEPGKFVILQFHGVPDQAHPWVHTPPEKFREYMDYLKTAEFEVIALRDLSRYTHAVQPPLQDPMTAVRYP